MYKSSRKEEVHVKCTCNVLYVRKHVCIQWAVCIGLAGWYFLSATEDVCQLSSFWVTLHMHPLTIDYSVQCTVYNVDQWLWLSCWMSWVELGEKIHWNGHADRYHNHIAQDIHTLTHYYYYRGREYKRHTHTQSAAIKLSKLCIVYTVHSLFIGGI